LSAKIEIEPNSEPTRRPNIVSTIEVPPTSSGSSAATTLRKNRKVRRKRNGNTRSSARLRSLPACLLTW
jgi:hypothetical protein